jgi:hypothetical protein
MNGSNRFRSVPLNMSPEVADLARAVEELPATYRHQLEPLLDRVIEGTTRRRRILLMVQDVLSQLRLDMKYLLFDLEATRRERDDAVRAFSERDSDDRGEG